MSATGHALNCRSYGARYRIRVCHKIFGRRDFANIGVRVKPDCYSHPIERDRFPWLGLQATAFSLALADCSINRPASSKPRKRSIIV
jgi:hypothetical protein